MLENFYQKYKNEILFLVLILFSLNFLIYVEIIKLFTLKDAQIYFLNVGQGDSQLIILPKNIKILIDGGPLNKNLLLNLDKILPFYDRYIDLVINTHSQLDHYGGFLELLQRYKVGYFLSNEQENNNVYFLNLKKIISDKKIKTSTLDFNDKISYSKSFLKVVWPKKLNKGSFNDNSLVLLFIFNDIKTLFTSDIGLKVEKELIGDLTKIDILKVAHHGSKNSNSLEFLKFIQPKIAVIEVGKNNYGHPHFQTLRNLALINSKVFRTDLDGQIKINLKSGRRVEIMKENNIKF